MKSFLCFTGICLLTSLFFAACQKQIDNAAINIPVNPVVDDSIYLDKVYDIYDAGAGLDTQYISSFNYDNLKRLSV